MIAYFDCFSGASGDMILGALIHAGASLERLRQDLAALPVQGYRLNAVAIRKQGFAATQVEVEIDPNQAKPHRHLKHIKAIIEGAQLPPDVQAKSLAVFQRLAEAEAEAHGSTVEKVHFHEAGALDAIVDVVGSVLALKALEVDRVVCSPIPTGSGTVRCEHGVMPIPAPGTAALLRGIPLMETDEVGELTTPTGAAILTTLASSFGPLPTMTLRTTGYGAGRREGQHRPNLLRVLLGEPGHAAERDQIVVLETNLDDVSAEAVGHCTQKLLDMGALDVYQAPITMKKSRAGVVLTVLCTDADVERIEEVIFRETTTFGIRRHSAQRTKLERRHETVETPFGPLRIKVGSRKGKVYTAAPEYEDCLRAADASGAALKDVMRAGQKAWEDRRPVDG